MQSVFFGKKNTSNNCCQVLTNSLFSRYWNTTNIVKNDNEIINKKVKRQIPMTIIIHNNDATSNSDDIYYDTNDDTKNNINDTMAINIIIKNGEKNHMKMIIKG